MAVVGQVDSEVGHREHSKLRPIHLGYVLFFMMLVVPSTYQELKAGLLLAVLCVAFFALIQGHLALHPSVLGLTLFYMALGTFFIFMGSLRAAPGALASARVYVLWPPIFVILASGLRTERDVTGIMRTLILASLTVELLSLAYILYAEGSIAYFPALDLGQDYGLHPGYIEFSLYSLASLLFLVPFLLSILFAWPSGSVPPLPRPLIWVAAGLGLVVTVLSGRRGLMLTVAVSPLIFMGLRSFLVEKEQLRGRPALFRRVCMAAIVLIAGFQYVTGSLGLKPESVVRYTEDAFTSERVRPHQFEGLIDSWSQHPILGWGLGAASSNVVRSAETPWAYELSYVALLFHVGLLGIAAYGAGLLWILWKGVQLIRSGGVMALYMLSTLTGTIGFLIANATNPYLEKFDYMWVVFLPVALINVWLLRGLPGPAGRGKLAQAGEGRRSAFPFDRLIRSTRL